MFEEFKLLKVCINLRMEFNYNNLWIDNLFINVLWYKKFALFSSQTGKINLLEIPENVTN